MPMRRGLSVFAYSSIAYGQAAVEYALKSGGSAVSASGEPATVGSCRVDSSLLTCLSESYPKTMIVLLALLTILILWRVLKACTSSQ